MKKVLSSVFYMIDAIVSKHRHLEVFLDDLGGFVVLEDQVELCRGESITECWDFIAGRFYKYGYDFDVMGCPGDMWAKSMFRSGRLDPNKYRLIGGI